MNDDVIVKKLAEANRLEVEKAIKTEYLAKVANATAASLDALCFEASDRINVVLHLLCGYAVITGGNKADLQQLVGRSFDDIARAHKKDKKA